MSKYFNLISFILILFSAILSAQVTVQAWVGQLGDGARVEFQQAFSQVPIVLTSAQVNGRAISSCALDVTFQGFRISLRDDAGRSVSNAWVQYIAFIPNPSAYLIGGVTRASHGQRISFSKLPTIPVIVTNAQKNGVALISGAVNNSDTGFNIYIFDDRGNSVSDAWLIWMAVIPDNSKNGFRGEVRQLSDGQVISFSPAFGQDPAFVLSAQPGVIAGALSNRRDGFVLSLISHDGYSARGVWVQWLGAVSTVISSPSVISYIREGGGTNFDNQSGTRGVETQDDWVKPWILAQADGLGVKAKTEEYSSLRAFSYRKFRTVAPNSNFYRADVTVRVAVRGIVDRVSYVTPIGGCATQYAVKVVVGIVEGGNVGGAVDVFPGYKTEIWHAASDPLLDFLQEATLAIVGSVVEYVVPGADVAISLVTFGADVRDADESVNKQFEVKFRNIRLKGNQEYCVYIYLHGVAKAIARGVGAGICEIDFLYHEPHISDKGGDPMGGRGIKLIDYSVTFY